MTAFDDILRRLREIREPDQREPVLAFDKVELMTRTQACRFRELQERGMPSRPEVARDLPEQPWYALHEAAVRLDTSMTALLAGAAEGDFRCFVFARHCQGNWDAPQSVPVPASVPDYLALSRQACREIAAYGSANLAELELPETTGRVLRLRLREPLFAEARTVFLQHPLPAACG